jgi:heme exporter protein A
MIDQLVLSKIAIERGGRSLFRGFDLSLEAGDTIALVGRNGSGKTSLLRVVAGLTRPAEGTVTFLHQSQQLDVDSARCGGLHLLGHLDGLKLQRTLRQELEFMVQWLGADRDRQAYAVERLSLAPLLDIQIRRLSAGQKRRAALSRLLIRPRPLWLLDEPLSPLDQPMRTIAGEIMAEHLSQGGMMIAAIHDPLPIPARMCEVGQ